MRLPLFLLVLPTFAFGLEFDAGETITPYAGDMGKAIPADLDGDGDIDFLTRELQAEVVTAYENTGEGKFERAMVWDSAHWDTLGDLADFDGDGLPDLLLKAAETVDGVRWTSLRIAFGDGLDGFGTRELELGLVQGVGRLVVADADGSGSPDIIVNGVTLIDPGNGEPVRRVTTARRTSDFVGSDPQELYWSDWTGDGLVDVFTSNAWWENLGGGHFAVGHSLPKPEMSDVRPIVPIRDSRLPGGRGLIGVHRIYNGDYVSRLSLSVMDREGKWVEADSVRMNPGKAYCKIPAFFQQQDGTVQAAVVLEFRPKVWSRPFRFSRELVEFSVSTSRGKPALHLQPLVKDLPARALVALKTDVDQDGRDDFFVATGSTGDPPDDSANAGEQLIYHRGTRAGGFEARAVEITPVSPRDEVRELVDFDRDGDLDLVTAVDRGDGTRQIGWLENLGGAGAFRRHVLLSAPGLVFVSAKDRNEDGIPDILALRQYLVNRDKGFRTIELSLSTGGGRRVTRTVFRQADIAESIRCEAADWDGDGLDDIVMWDYLYSRPDFDLIGTPVRWLKGLPGNHFADPQSLGESAWQTLYDADGDGDLDMVPYTGNYDPEVWGSFRWRENTGSGVPVWREFPQVGGVQVGIEPAFADLDSDGRMDFVSASRPLLSRANGAFVERPALPPGRTWFHDLDGDGDPDAVIRLAEDYDTMRVANLVWLENLGGAVFSEPEILDAVNSSQWHDIFAGDLNGDGRTDIAANSWLSSRPRIGWLRGK